MLIRHETNDGYRNAARQRVFSMSRPPTLPRALDAELRETTGRAGRLAYYVGGDGPPLLLCNGLGGNWELFTPLIEALPGA